MAQRAPHWLAFGVTAHDTRRGRVGTVTGIGDPYPTTLQDLSDPATPVYLRPPGGGIEWESTIGDLRPEAGT
jgi:hypothetical protein